MIQSGVEKEVLAALKPIEERIEMQEKVNQELHRKLSALHQQLETIKEDRNSQEGFPALPEPQVQQGHHEGPQSDEKRRQFMNKGWGRGKVIRSSEEVMKEDLCAAARKVIGFSSIEVKDVGVADEQLWCQRHGRGKVNGSQVILKM